MSADSGPTGPFLTDAPCVVPHRDGVTVFGPIGTPVPPRIAAVSASARPVPQAAPRPAGRPSLRAGAHPRTLRAGGWSVAERRLAVDAER